MLERDKKKKKKTSDELIEEEYGKEQGEDEFGDSNDGSDEGYY